MFLQSVILSSMWLTFNLFEQIFLTEMHFLSCFNSFLTVFLTFLLFSTNTLRESHNPNLERATNVCHWTCIHSSSLHISPPFSPPYCIFKYQAIYVSLTAKKRTIFKSNRCSYRLKFKKKTKNCWAMVFWENFLLCSQGIGRTATFRLKNRQVWHYPSGIMFSFHHLDFIFQQHGLLPESCQILDVGVFSAPFCELWMHHC